MDDEEKESLFTERTISFVLPFFRFLARPFCHVRPSCPVKRSRYLFLSTFSRPFKRCEVIISSVSMVLMFVLATLPLLTTIHFSLNRILDCVESSTLKSVECLTTRPSPSLLRSLASNRFDSVHHPLRLFGDGREKELLFDLY